MIAAVALYASQHLVRSATVESANEDLRPAGEVVVRLLESGDVKKFADEIVPTLKDWQAVRATNADAKDGPLGLAFQEQLARDRRNVEASAQRVLERAKGFGLEPSRIKFKVQEVPARYLSTSRLPAFQPLPWLPETEVILLGEPRSSEADKLRGEYRLALGGMRGGTKFPAGWRFSDGLRWKSFPPGVADKKTESELALLNKVFAMQGLRLADDSALAALGSVLTRFLRDQDPQVFVSGALRTMDEIWAEVERKSVEFNRPLPPKKEFEKVFGEHKDRIGQSAQGVLDQCKTLGINFSNADIRLKEAVAEHAYHRGKYGDLAGITCDQLRFTFEVRSELKTKAGQSISGEYILAAARAQRGPERWTIEDQVRWQQFPSDQIDDKAKAALEFENYVAEHNVLPSGTTAPEFEFFRLDSGPKAKSADFRGKIIILEFWATWCGPCQGPMAKLQQLRAKHPEWKDRVEILTVSIDDEKAQAQRHLEKRGWTNAVSLWAGEGGVNSTTAKAFRLKGIPTAYVLDSGGKVAWAGHPGNPLRDPIAETVKTLLK